MIKHAALNVSLTPELVAFVAAQMASGRYASASEVARAPLRRLEGESSVGQVNSTSVSS